MLHQNKGINQERRHKKQETGDGTHGRSEENPGGDGEGPSQDDSSVPAVRTRSAGCSTSERHAGSLCSRRSN